MIGSLFLLFLALTEIWFKICIMKGYPTFSIFTCFDNSPSCAPSSTRQLTYLYLHLINFFSFNFPFYICCVLTVKSIPFNESYLDVWNIRALLFYLIIFVIFYRYAQKLVYLHRFTLHLHYHDKSPILCTILSMMNIPFIPAT